VYNKYYQDELSYLRELGREFAHAYPDAAQFIGEPGSDPDVERLLEGFSFLTARIRQKIDDELPELTHAILEMFWPHYLRPIPAMAIVQFEPLPQAAKEARTIPRGVELDSVPVDGTACRFRTAYETLLTPVTLQGLELRQETPPSVRLRFRFAEGVGPKKFGADRIRLFLHGEAPVTRALYICLCRYLKSVTLRGTEGAGAGRPVVLGPEALTPIGFRPEDLLLPFPGTSFQGFRLLQEYFAFPAKFMFLDVRMDRIAEIGEARAFEMQFDLTRLPEGMPSVSQANVLLNCTPVVNLFKHDGDPVRITHERTEYRLRPAGANSHHYEIYTIDKVTGNIQGNPKPRLYHAFFSFAHSLRPSGDDVSYYRARVEASPVGDGTDVYASFMNRDTGGKIPEVETVSFDLTCTNRQLPSKLKIGDLSVPTSSMPPIARFKNISRISPSVTPPVGGDLYWRLLSHLSLNYLTLVDIETFRGILLLYHFRALVDRPSEQALKQLLSGIKSLAATPSTRMMQGTPVRGIAVSLELDEENFAGEGELYLFSAVINEFLALYVTLNAFSQLTVKGTRYGETHQWPPRIGSRIIL